MKNFIALFLACSIALTSVAQRHLGSVQPLSRLSSPLARTTAIGDTLTLTNIAASDTDRLLYNIEGGSGYTAGTNAYNDKAFAERYAFSGADSSLQVIGVVTHFSGAVNPASTRTITLKIWSQSDRVTVSQHKYYQGFPNTILDSLVVPVTQLGIGTTTDTIKQFLFPTPTNKLNEAFFAGYTINYNFNTLSGDTIALTAGKINGRTTPYQQIRYVTGTAGDTLYADTLINVQNATQWSDGLWYDNLTQSDSLNNHLAIYPIVIVHSPTGILAPSQHGLAIGNAFPNPASGSISIPYTTATTTQVQLRISDMSGKVVHTASALSAATSGQFQVSTASLPAGNYIYLITTATGAGMAGIFAVQQ